jgi:hypothetical protein
MFIAVFDDCETCGAVHVSNGSGNSLTVPGTGVLDCYHQWSRTDSVSVIALVHVALSTLLRSGSLDRSAADTAHMLQEWIAAPTDQRRASQLPYLLRDGYGVSSIGLAAARVLCSAISREVGPDAAYYWKAAASVMRRRLP